MDVHVPQGITDALRGMHFQLPPHDHAKLVYCIAGRVLDVLLELRKLIAHYLKERVEKQLNAGRERLRAMTQAIPEGLDGSGKVLRARLKSLQGWHDKSRRLLPAIRVLLKLSP